MKKALDIIKNTAQSLNDKKNTWSYLTSIEYMLESKLYIDSLCEDAERITKHTPKIGCGILDFGTGCGIFAIILRELSATSEIFALDTVKDKSQNNPLFNDMAYQQGLLYKKFGKIFEINFSHYDGSRIPFADDSFDIVSAYAVIEHIEDGKVDSILEEIKRILKPNGLFCVFKLPRKLAIQEHLGKMLKLGTHEVLFGDRESRNLFKKHSFDVIEKYKSDMVFEFPGKVTNKLYYILKILAFLLYYSPFRIFAHHNNMILINRK